MKYKDLRDFLTQLEAMGELDNTYIFYTSDHGIAIGRHGLQGKQNLYQHTWRVPFIVKGPGIRPGSGSSVCGVADRVEIPTGVRPLADALPKAIQLVPPEGGGEAASKGNEKRVFRRVRASHRCQILPSRV